MLFEVDSKGPGSDLPQRDSLSDPSSKMLTLSQRQDLHASISKLKNVTLTWELLSASIVQRQSTEFG